jgi:hypothetical protein
VKASESENAELARNAFEHEKILVDEKADETAIRIDDSVK